MCRNGLSSLQRPICTQETTSASTDMILKFPSQSSTALNIEVLYIWSILLPLCRINSLIRFHFILLHVPLKKKRLLATGSTSSQIMYSGASSGYLHVFPQICNSSYSWNSFLTQLQYNWCIFHPSVIYALGETMNRTILYRYTLSCKGSCTE